MLALFQFILVAAQVYLLWQILGVLKVIARDTAAKEELVDSIEKFGQIFAAREKKKVVAFKVKDDDATP